MTTSLSQLLHADEPDDVLSALTALFTHAGFPATSWQSGSVPNVVLTGEADYFADLGSSIASIARGGFIDLCETDDETDQFCGSTYQEDRNPATFTLGQVVLSDTASQGPFTILPGTFWVADGTGLLLFNNNPQVGNKTLPLGGTVTLDMQAESPGAAYNLTVDGITQVVTSLPGVTVSNPAIIGSTTWITTAGTDQESTPNYKARCKAKWGTLGSGSNEEAYRYNSLTPSVTGTTEPTRAKITNDDTTGIVTVTIAGASGPISSAGLALVDAVMQKKRPLCVQVSTVNATPSNSQIAGTVYISGSFDLTATLAAVKVALDQLGRGVDIAGSLTVDDVVATVRAVPGVTNFAMTALGALTPPITPGLILMLPASTVFTPVYVLTASR